MLRKIIRKKCWPKLNTGFLTVIKELQKLAGPVRAKNSLRFFKTGPGEYGAGDKFIGVATSQQRIVAKKYQNLDEKNLQALLKSPIHEHRFTALVILKSQYLRADEKIKKKLFNFYLKNRKFVNNWDLVDTSAEYLVGDYLRNRAKTLLYKLAKSKSVWDRRIAVLATFNFIKHQQFEATFKLAELLIHDKHDLIHKAVGWMLREVGNRSLVAEEKFLRQFSRLMPRTMLRYAIEKFPPAKRLAYLQKTLAGSRNQAQGRFRLSCCHDS